MKQPIQLKFLTWPKFLLNTTSNTRKWKLYFAAHKLSCYQLRVSLRGEGGIFAILCKCLWGFCSVLCCLDSALLYLHSPLSFFLEYHEPYRLHPFHSVLFRSITSPFPSWSLQSFARSCTQAVCISGIRWTSTALWCITRCTWVAHLGETCTTTDNKNLK